MDEDRCSLCDVMFTLKPSGRAYIKSKLTSRVIKGQRTSTLDVLKDIYDYKGAGTGFACEECVTNITDAFKAQTIISKAEVNTPNSRYAAAHGVGNVAPTKTAHRVMLASKFKYVANKGTQTSAADTRIHVGKPQTVRTKSERLVGHFTRCRFSAAFNLILSHRPKNAMTAFKRLIAKLMKCEMRACQKHDIFPKLDGLDSIAELKWDNFIRSMQTAMPIMMTVLEAAMTSRILSVQQERHIILARMAFIVSIILFNSSPLKFKFIQGVIGLLVFRAENCPVLYKSLCHLGVCRPYEQIRRIARAVTVEVDAAPENETDAKMMLDKIEGFIDDKIRCFDFDVNIEQNDAQKNSTQQSDKQDDKKESTEEKQQENQDEDEECSKEKQQKNDKKESTEEKQQENLDEDEECSKEKQQQNDDKECPKNKQQKGIDGECPKKKQQKTGNNRKRNCGQNSPKISTGKKTKTQAAITKSGKKHKSPTSKKTKTQAAITKSGKKHKSPTKSPDPGNSDTDSAEEKEEHSHGRNSEQTNAAKKSARKKIVKTSGQKRKLEAADANSREEHESQKGDEDLGVVFLDNSRSGQVLLMQKEPVIQEKPVNRLPTAITSPATNLNIGAKQINLPLTTANANEKRLIGEKFKLNDFAAKSGKIQKMANTNSSENQNLGISGKSDVGLLVRDQVSGKQYLLIPEKPAVSEPSVINPATVVQHSTVSQSNFLLQNQKMISLLPTNAGVNSVRHVGSSNSAHVKNISSVSAQIQKEIPDLCLMSKMLRPRSLLDVRQM